MPVEMVASIDEKLRALAAGRPYWHRRAFYLYADRLLDMRLLVAFVAEFEPEFDHRRP